MSVLLAVYDPETGEIRRRVTCSESIVDAQARNGEAILEVERGTIFSDATHFVDLTGAEPQLTAY